MSRTGLAAEVPTLELCRDMAAVPALAEAFRKSSVCIDPSHDRPVHIRIGGTAGSCAEAKMCYPAPTVREMLLTLKQIRGVEWPWAIPETDDITDPDALARACIEAAKS
jgi:hypothetical protein